MQEWLNFITSELHKSFGPIFRPTTPEEFKKISKELLQQPIEPAQAEKLLATGKTDLLEKFISKAGRPFPAYLVMDKTGKVSFEFPPREGEG